MGQDVELATLVEMDEAGRLWEDLESSDRLHAVNTEEWIFVVFVVQKDF